MASYNDPYCTPQPDPSNYNNAQAQQKGSYHNAQQEYQGQTTDDYWKGQLSGLAGAVRNSNIPFSSASASTAQPRSLQDELDGIEKRVYSIKIQAEKTLESLFGSVVGLLETQFAEPDEPTFAKRLSKLYNLLVDIDATLDRVNSKIGGR